MTRPCKTFPRRGSTLTGSPGSSWPARRGRTATTLSTPGPNDRALRDALDQGLARLIARGDLRRLYEKYGIWSEAQRELENFTGPLEVISGRPAAWWLGPGEPVLVVLVERPVSPSPVARLDAAGNAPGPGDRDRPDRRVDTAANVVLTGYVSRFAARR